MKFVVCALLDGLFSTWAKARDFRVCSTHTRTGISSCCEYCRYLLGRQPGASGVLLEVLAQLAYHLIYIFMPPAVAEVLRVLRGCEVPETQNGEKSIITTTACESQRQSHHILTSLNVQAQNSVKLPTVGLSRNS